MTPTETVGPYPSLVDLFRSDIREGKSGTVLTLTIRVVNAAMVAQPSPMPTSRSGTWTQPAITPYGTQRTQTFLRGIQTTNSNGEVTFTTIYPGWYQGRATHIHVEVTVAGRSVKVTQIAFPETINNTVHTSGAYASRGTNPMSNLADGILATVCRQRSSRQPAASMAGTRRRFKSRFLPRPGLVL